MFELASASATDDRLKTMYRETAETLDSISFLYNELYNSANEAIEKSNGQDPAINILFDKMREHMGSRKRIGEQE